MAPWAVQVEGGFGNYWWFVYITTIFARGILVTILHCGTPELCLSAIYIVSSVGTSLESHASNVIIRPRPVTWCINRTDFPDIYRNHFCALVYNVTAIATISSLDRLYDALILELISH